MSEDDKYEELEKYLKENKIDLRGYIKYRHIENTKLLDLPEESFEKFSEYFNQLEEDSNIFKKTKKHKLTPQQRGRLLEDISGILFFNNNALFEKYINCKTATNEIDILVNWSKTALQLGFNNAYKYLGDSFLCECKNYNKKVNVTYIGKFFSLMTTCNVKFGILFSIDGMSGKNIWIDGKGLARKIALNEKKYIIDFNWSDLEKIYKKEANILSIIDNKFNAMKNDINYDSYIKKHENEDYFDKMLNLE